MEKKKMSNGFKKWLKICAVLYGIFFIGGMVFRDLNLTMFMLALLVGLMIFVGLQLIKTLWLGIKKSFLAIHNVVTTKYVIVFKF